MNITFVTGNANKAKECSTILGVELEAVGLDIPEIQSLNLEKVVEAKAKAAFAQLGTPVMVEDVALSLLALGDLPGPFIRWFEESVGLEGLCVLATELNERRAVATSCIGYCDGGEVQLFTGEVLGTISSEPRGQNGFGWDAIFKPGDSKQTWAEVTPEEKDTQSMRMIALTKFKEYLMVSLPGMAEDLQTNHAKGDDGGAKDHAKDTKLNHSSQNTKKNKKRV